MNRFLGRHGFFFTHLNFNDYKLTTKVAVKEKTEHSVFKINLEKQKKTDVQFLKMTSFDPAREAHKIIGQAHLKLDPLSSNFKLLNAPFCSLPKHLSKFFVTV